MRAVIIYSLMFVLLAGMSASAFDGKRKGLVAGFGVGLSPYLATKADSADIHLKFGAEGGALEIMIGYGFDEHNVLVYHKLTASFPYIKHVAKPPFIEIR